MIVSFTILIIIIIVLTILNIKTFTNQKLYKKKYNDLDRASKEVINRQQKAVDEKVIKYKELDELYEQKITENKKLKQQLKQYEENHTYFVKEVPMKALVFKTEVVVPRELRNDKNYMEVIERSVCSKMADAIFKSKAYDISEIYNNNFVEYHLNYLFRFYK